MRLIKVLFIILMLLLFIGILVYKSWEAAQKKHADNTLKQIGMALENYHSAHSEQTERRELDKAEADGP